jgi:serralysin
MAGNDVYVVDQLVTGTATVVIDDDGFGVDTIDLGGVHDAGSSINLSWEVPAGVSTSGEAIYYTNGNVGHRLIVNGFIENARGSNGADYIAGNEGDNVLVGDQDITGPGGNDTIGGDEGNDSIYGGSGADSIDGAEDDDLLFGDAGSDMISGGGGIDTVEGGAGADSLSGGASGGDTISYRGSSGAVTVGLEFGTTVDGFRGDAQGDRINGFSAVLGSEFGDILFERNGASLKLDNHFFGFGGSDGLTLNGGNDLGDGGDGSDSIYGGAGNDTIFGGAGADRLGGGVGKDVLKGDGGADRFVFVGPSDSTTGIAGRDRIDDFRRAQGDRIDLLAIDAKSGAGNQAFDFIGTRAFTGDKGDLRYVKAGTDLVVMGDINGDKRADFAIAVDDTANLRAGDFIL